jgi:hypothetical protein
MNLAEMVNYSGVYVMKTRDLINMLNRAAAVINDPASETEEEKEQLVQDLISEATSMEVPDELT